MNPDEQNIIIYNTADGKSSVALYAKDGMIWMNQNQLAELFDTSKQNVGQHIISILKDKELSENSVVKNFFTTALEKRNNPGFNLVEFEQFKHEAGFNDLISNIAQDNLMKVFRKGYLNCN